MMIKWHNCLTEPDNSITLSTKLIVRTIRGNIKVMTLDGLIEYIKELYITETYIHYNTIKQKVMYAIYTNETWQKLIKECNHDT